MIDKEIIKALEIHINEFDKTGISVDNNRLDKLTLDLINRQQAEIIRLKSMNQSKLDAIHDLRAQNEILSKNADAAFQEGLNERRELFEPEIKAEAIKEFTERLKNKIKTECNPYGKPTFDYDTSVAIMRYIDNLVKEMVGETNDT